MVFRGRLSYLGIFLLGACVSAGLHLKYRADRAVELKDFRGESHIAAQSAGDRVERTLHDIYCGLRTIARLPGVRGIDRYARQFDGNASRTTQEIYNNLAASVAMSEVYIVPLDMDPDKWDLNTGWMQAPITTFDELILGQDGGTPESRSSSQFMPNDCTRCHATVNGSRPPPHHIPVTGRVEEIEYYEYKLMTEQMAWMRAHCPTSESVKGLDFPAVIGREVITCDNSRYDPAHPNNKDRSGIVYSVPFFGPNGQLQGCVSGIVLTSVLQDLLGTGDYVLLNTGPGYSAPSTKSGLWKQFRAEVEQGRKTDSLLYSEVLDLGVRDAMGDWKLWACRPDAEFWNRSDVRSSRRFYGIAHSINWVVALGASIFLFNGRKNRAALRRQNEELELRVQERTLDLREQTFFLERQSRLLAEANAELEANRGEMLAQQGELLALNRELETSKAAAEQALGELEAYKFALDHHSILTTTDLAGRITYANAKFCEISKYSREELEGQTHRLVNSGHHPREFWAEAWRAALRGEIWRGEVCNRAKDGSLYWVDATIAGLKGLDGKIEKLIGIRTDITARKQAELEISQREREAQLCRRIAAMAAEGISCEQCLQNCVDLICEFTGWPVGHVYHVSAPPEKVARSSGIWHVEDAQFSGEFRRASDELTFAPGVGLPGRVVASGRSIWISDVEAEGSFSRTEACNTASVRAALAIPVMIGSDVVAVFEFFHRNSIPEDEALLTLLEGIGIQISRVMERKRFEADLAVARESAESASRSKSEFLANMSHEIRTPMTAILGFADVLLEDGDVSRAPERRINAIRTIQRNGEHLLGLINDILDVSKIEAGRMNVETIPCEPCQVLAEVLSLMQVRAEPKGIYLRLESEGPIPRAIQGDPLRLRQILINVVGNAIKFTEHGGIRLVVRHLSEGGSRIQFDVIDTGIGMDAEQAAALFSPFTQADSSMARRFGGTGLGLTISRRLAEMLGGSLELHCTAPGEGSTMRVTVMGEPVEGTELIAEPVKAVYELAAHQSSPMRAAGEQIGEPLKDVRILLAEDGVDNQRLITHVLRKAGAIVSVVENGRAAVKLALEAVGKSEPFDVILTDMQMPIMDGYEAASLLRAEGYRGPIIALTAHAMAGEREKCIKAGCDEYATKPIDRAALIDTIRSHARRWRAGCASSASAI